VIFVRALWGLIVHTAVECVKRKVIYLFLLLGIGFLILSAFFYSPNASSNLYDIDSNQVAAVARSTSLHLVALFGMVVGIILAMDSYIAKPADHLKNPSSVKVITPHQYLIGRFLGTLSATIFAALILAVLAILIFAIRLGYLDLQLWSGLSIVAVELGLAVSLTSFLSIFINRTFSALLVIFAYILSLILGIESVKEMIIVLPKNVVVKIFMQVLYALTPPFGDIQNLADEYMNGIAPPQAEWYSFFVGIFYLLVLLGFSLIIFNRKSKRKATKPGKQTAKPRRRKKQ